ncbi:MAG: SH3 domain-containing protein [Chloroflexota bacterium]
MRSKKLLIVLVFIGMILAVSVALAQPPGDPDAADAGETITGIVEFDGTRVYVGPDFAYDSLGQLDINTSVVILGRRGDFYYSWDGNQWLEVAFNNETGWIYARLLRTSIPFNSIPPTGRALPRNRNSRVPGVFNLSDNVCDAWTGNFTLSGSFAAGDQQLTVTYPELKGANVYSVITISPSGQRTAHDSTTTTAHIKLADLPREPGQYVWRVVPYWTNAKERYNWQQICLLQTGGTFDVPGEPLPTLPPRYRYYYYSTPMPSPTPAPLVP